MSQDHKDLANLSTLAVTPRADIALFSLFLKKGKIEKLGSTNFPVFGPKFHMS